MIEAKPAASPVVPPATVAEARAESVPTERATARPALLGPEPVTLGGVVARVAGLLPAGVRRRLVQGRRWANRRRTTIAWGFVVLLSGLGIAALVAASLAKSTPSWWTPIDYEDPELRELARLVENGAISHITADHQGSGAGAREAVVWPVKLSDEGANAWLKLRLPVWLPKLTAGEFEEIVDERGVVIETVPMDGLEWPEAVREVRMVFSDGRFRIGALVESDGQPRYFSATLAPEIREDGSLWMRATRVGIGRLALPAWLVLGDDGGWIRGSMPADLRATAEAEAIFEKLAGAAPLFEDAVIRLGDGRRVRLLTLTVGEASLVAQFRTEWESLAESAETIRTR